MVNITTYNQYWQHVAATIAGLEAAYLVANEAQLKTVVANVAAYPILVATIPSADADSRDEDNLGEMNTGLIFILKKVADSDRTSAGYVADMATLQTVMAGVKSLMLDDKTNCDSEYHELMYRLQVGSMHQDPEYNYLGHDGWSLSFKIGSIGM
jgi:hypothetical protein